MNDVTKITKFKLKQIKMCDYKHKCPDIKIKVFVSNKMNLQPLDSSSNP